MHVLIPLYSTLGMYKEGITYAHNTCTRNAYVAQMHTMCVLVVVSPVDPMILGIGALDPVIGAIITCVSWAHNTNNSVHRIRHYVHVLIPSIVHWACTRGNNMYPTTARNAHTQ